MTTLGTIFFKTRAEARSFATKTKRKAPTTKQAQGWAVVIK